MPGFVDPHTHLVFAGSREDEFVKKIHGMSYLEIMKEGGGILSTVRATRKSSKKELISLAWKRLDRMLRYGTTTAEVKSGYGLDLKNEIKCLEVVKWLNKKHNLDLIPTFLGAHAIPPEFERKRRGYVDLIINKMIPEVSKRGLAEYCDVFCEKDVFSLEEAREILQTARKFGMKLKMHADELTGLGGAELAAELHATSADHLDHISDQGIKKMAEAYVIGVLLPGVPFHLMTERYAPAKKMIRAGMAVALATDFNPGSCPTESMFFIIALACRKLRMTPAQAITASTINAAHAIDMADEVGSLEPGKKADIIILDIPNHKHIAYRFGINLVSKVIKDGKIVVDKEKLVKSLNF
jgi:imidazolonepropionase